MYDYITIELINLLSTHDNFKSKLNMQQISITGHSMGGHGALTIYLKNSNLFKSCSAFSPIVNPLKCPWGEKAFTGYLQNGMQEGQNYDACYLVENFQNSDPNQQSYPILIDQGSADNFLQDQLLSNNILTAVNNNKNDHKLEINLRFQEGYDHSYYFISSFIDEHLEFHRNYL